MIGEIAVIPQQAGPARETVSRVVDEISAQGLRYKVEATGTSVEGELDAILGAVHAVVDRLVVDGVDRAVVEVRLQLEPHEETLEHQVEGVGQAEGREEPS